jgi:hypothetical protein
MGGTALRSANAFAALAFCLSTEIVCLQTAVCTVFTGVMPSGTPPVTPHATQGPQCGGPWGSRAPGGTSARAFARLNSPPLDPPPARG